MSEYQKITSVVRTKDPRRVEAGRRLAAISRQAKERKARERQVSATADTANTANPEEPANTTVRLGLVVSVLGVAVGAAGVYYAYNNRGKPKPSNQDRQTPKDEQTPTKKTVLDSLD